MDFSKVSSGVIMPSNILDCNFPEVSDQVVYKKICNNLFWKMELTPRFLQRNNANNYHDHDVLRENEDYSALLRTLALLQAQKSKWFIVK